MPTITYGKADMLWDRVHLAQANALGLPSPIDDEYERLIEEPPMSDQGFGNWLDYVDRGLDWLIDWFAPIALTVLIVGGVVVAWFLLT